MNNYIDTKNKYKQKLTILNLETRETVDIIDSVEKMRLGVFATNGFVMVQEQSEVIYFNLLGRNLRVMKNYCLLYTSPSPRDATLSRMPSSA